MPEKVIRMGRRREGDIVVRQWGRCPIVCPLYMHSHPHEKQDKYCGRHMFASEPDVLNTHASNSNKFASEP